MSGLETEQQERQRLFRNGFSASFETEIPVSPRSPQEAIAEERKLRATIRAVAAAAIFALLLATMAALLVATVARCRKEGGTGCLIPQKAVPLEWGGLTKWPPGKTVSRIAFGSCTSYDIREQPVWEQGVIPSQPDAWVWLGDMFYADEPAYDCGQVSGYAVDCQCEADWLKTPPFNCKAGELDNAREKMAAQVNQPGYQAFLRYSCPGFDAGGTAMPFPWSVPPGDDLEVCPRPILGIYDDHDYGVNNFNRRLPQKHLFKQIFLDALGVPASSPRRLAQQGAQWRYTLNPGQEGKEVELILLDERYERATLPCEVRYDWCIQMVLSTPGHPYYHWCDDFIYTGGTYNVTGSCCKADREIYWGYCQKPESHADPLWDVGCNTSSPLYGTQPLVLSNSRLMLRDVTRPEQLEEDSPFCDLLGPQQRQWLDSVLAASRAPVKLIASSSVVFGSTGLDNNTAETYWQGRCSGDDWDCYRPAQLALLQTLQRHAAAHGGCFIILTGDYHYSDVKVAYPGTKANYSQAYNTANWVTPIYQVMASGLSNGTARPLSDCREYRMEHSGLRIEGSCGYVKLPAFGMLEFDWGARRLSMQIRGAEGDIGGTVQQRLTISLDTCLPV